MDLPRIPGARGAHVEKASLKTTGIPVVWQLAEQSLMCWNRDVPAMHNIAMYGGGAIAGSLASHDYPYADGELARWAEAARSAGYDLSRLARNAGFTPKQLRRYFNAQHWGNPKGALDRVRVICAAAAVLGGWSAKRAAIDFGYRDPSHFNRALKRHLGQSPSEFAHPAMPGEICLGAERDVFCQCHLSWRAKKNAAWSPNYEHEIISRS